MHLNLATDTRNSNHCRENWLIRTYCWIQFLKLRTVAWHIFSTEHRRDAVGW